MAGGSLDPNPAVGIALWTRSPERGSRRVVIVAHSTIPVLIAASCCTNVPERWRVDHGSDGGSGDRLRVAAGQLNLDRLRDPGLHGAAADGRHAGTLTAGPSASRVTLSALPSDRPGTSQTSVTACSDRTAVPGAPASRWQRRGERLHVRRTKGRQRHGLCVRPEHILARSAAEPIESPPNGWLRAPGRPAYC